MFKSLQYSEWSAIVQEKFMKNCVESIVRYDSICIYMKVSVTAQKYYTPMPEPEAP